MIEWLNIKNLALVEEAEVEFATGFNVITGETGAGKSVIMGAISLLLGERAGKNILRKGADRCEICAGIALTGKIAEKVNAILANSEIRDSQTGEVLIKRVITPSSSRNFINDTPVTLQTLKFLGDILIDVHGPNEHQSLLKTSVQLEILDTFGNLENPLLETTNLYEALKEIREKVTKLEESLPSPLEAEHLRSIINSIESAAINIEKDSNLNEQHKLAANSKDILEFAEHASQLLNESEESIINQLSHLRRELTTLEKLNIPETNDFVSQCETLIEGTREFAFDIEKFSAKIDIDEQGFQNMEERILTLQTLKRKFGPTLEEVLKTAEKASEKLDNMDNYQFLREQLAEEYKAAEESLKKSCNALSTKRKKASANLAKKITSELKKLGFLKADFNIEFKETEPGPKGADSIEFIFTANPGEASNPLRKVASSGEISRVMLALKTVLADSDSVPILIFDEIDVNIGGKTAVVVGEELKKLGKTHQLISISHLPQVASAGDRHFRVEKHVKNGRTFTKIDNLTEKEQKDEITRMLGGGKAAELHAEELLKGISF